MIGYISTHTVLGLQHFLLREGNNLLVAVTNTADDAFEAITDNSGWEGLYPGQCRIATSVRDFIACELIFADGPLDPELYNALQALGLPLVATAPAIVRWEEDRGLAKTLAEHCGLNVAPGSQNLASAEAGAELLDTWAPKTLAVLKGDLNSVIMPASDAASFLRCPAAVDSIAAAETALHLEQFVAGREVAYGVWFNGSQYLPTAMLTREYKDACDGGQGWTLTGEVGTYFEFELLVNLPDAIYRVLAQLRPLLAAAGYRGFLDLNTLHTDAGGIEGWTFLEFTARPGFPTELEFAGWLRQCGQQYGDLLRWCAGLETDRPFQVPQGYGLAGALYAQGLGITTVNLPFQPQLHGGLSSRRNVELLPFDACWDAAAGTWRVFDWDRFVFVAEYHSQPASPLGARGYNMLCDSLNQELSRFKAWGHTTRSDLGSELRQSLASYDGDLHELPAPVAMVTDPLYKVGDAVLRRLAHCDALYFPDELAWDLEDWRDAAASEAELSASIDTNGNIAAYAVWTVRDGVHWLDNMLVLPAYRRQGLAQNLIQHRFLHSHTPAMALEAHNQAAVRTYARCGFVVDRVEGPDSEHCTYHMSWKPKHA